MLTRTKRGKGHLLRSDARGATAIEYGLFAAFLGVGLIAAIDGLGGGVLSIWTFVLNGAQAVL